MKARCAECGAALERDKESLKRYKRSFCNRTCRGLFETVYKTEKEMFKSRWERTKARMAADPLLKAKILTQMRESLARRLKDPAYKKARAEKIKATNKKRYHEDENYRAFRKEQIRAYKLAKWKKENAN